MSKMERHQELQAIRKEQMAKEHHQLPHPGHHHFDGYSDGEARAHLDGMGVPHSEHPHFGKNMGMNE